LFSAAFIAGWLCINKTTELYLGYVYILKFRLVGDPWYTNSAVEVGAAQIICVRAHLHRAAQVVRKTEQQRLGFPEPKAGAVQTRHFEFSRLATHPPTLPSRRRTAASSRLQLISSLSFCRTALKRIISACSIPSYCPSEWVYGAQFIHSR
jgi:hypothetical protein